MASKPNFTPGDMTRPVQSSDATLYVGNLHPSIEESTLYDMFRKFGEVVQCKLMKDIYSGESRGFAFVTY